jgi:hypothetical protein
MGDHAAAAACTLQPRRAAYFTAPRGRRIGRVNQNQLITCPEAFRFEQLQVFCVEQPRERSRFLRAELRDRFLFVLQNIAMLCNDGFQFILRPRHRCRQRIGQRSLTLCSFRTIPIVFGF